MIARTVPLRLLTSCRGCTVPS